ncbi:MAG: hypothetical protein ACE5H4_01205 [Candidatus Thorarchaeota archaeon]
MNLEIFALFGFGLVLYVILRVAIPRVLDEPDASCMFLLAPFAMLSFSSILILASIFFADHHGWQPPLELRLLPALITIVVFLDGFLLLRRGLKRSSFSSSPY